MHTTQEGEVFVYRILHENLACLKVWAYRTWQYSRQHVNKVSPTLASSADQLIKGVLSTTR